MSKVLCKVFPVRTEIRPRESECILGLLSCYTWFNCCRAHMSEVRSWDLIQD
jgi:hypothetical protein